MHFLHYFYLCFPYVLTEICSCINLGVDLEFVFTFDWHFGELCSVFRLR